MCYELCGFDYRPYFSELWIELLVRLARASGRLGAHVISCVHLGLQ